MGDFRVRDYLLYPAHIFRARNAARAAEQATPEQRRRLTQDRLAATLEHAVSQVPYYRETLAPFRRRFDNMVADLDLSPLPVLTKDAIRTAGPALWADDRARYRPVPGHTSGTTGSPMAFLLGSDSHVAHFAGIWNMLNWTGYRFTQPFADLHATTLPGNAWWYQDRRLNCLRLCAYQLSPDTIAGYNERLKQAQPLFLKGTPTVLYIFARLLEDAGIEPYQPRAILTCAETVYSHYRDTLARVFTGGIFDFYNQNERACLFSTCAYGTYHIHEDYSYVELAGESDGHAEVLATTWHNRSMPFIRYQTNDIAQVAGAPAPCPCGRSHRTVRRIVGRVHDVVALPDGRFCSSFAYLFEDQPGVRMAQIYQQQVSAIEVRLVVTPAFDRIAGPPRLEAEMRQWLGNTIDIHFTYPDALVPGSNGKVQFIESLPGRALIGGGADRSSITRPPHRAPVAGAVIGEPVR